MTNLQLQYSIENAFSGEPELAWRYLLDSGHHDAPEPGLFESLPEWLERLTPAQGRTAVEVLV